MERKTRVYCQIIECENNLGTTDKSEVMFRLPREKNRLEWIKEIEKHQKFLNKTNYNVCIRHFLNTDYIKKKDKYILKENAIPTIFKSSSDFIEIISNEIFDDCDSEVTKCSQCPCLLEKIKKLKHEILLLKTKHTISIGKIEQKNADLKMKNLEKTKMLIDSEKEKSKLKHYLDDIRAQNLISDDEQDFLNVSFNFNHDYLNLCIVESWNI